MCLCRLLAVLASVRLLQIEQNIPAGLSRPMNLLMMASSSSSVSDNGPSPSFKALHGSLLIIFPLLILTFSGELT